MDYDVAPAFLSAESPENKGIETCDVLRLKRFALGQQKALKTKGLRLVVAQGKSRIHQSAESPENKGIETHPDVLKAASNFDVSRKP